MDGQVIVAILLLLFSFLVLGAIVFMFVKSEKGNNSRIGKTKKEDTEETTDKKECEDMLPKDFAVVMEETYDDSDSILDLLEQLSVFYQADVAIAERISSAREYLLHSRYKDYETALYTHLGDDDRKDLKNLYAKIILKEIGKRKCLPMKE